MKVIIEQAMNFITSMVMRLLNNFSFLTFLSNKLN